MNEKHQISPPPSLAPARKRVLTRLRLVILILLVPVVLVFILFCARLTLLSYYDHKVKAEMKLLLADGGSTDPADLVPGHLPGADGTPPHALKLADFSYTYDIYDRRYISDSVVSLRDTKLSRDERIAAAIYRFGRWRGFREIPVSKGAPSRLATMEWDDDWVPFIEEHLQANAKSLSVLKREAAAGSGYFEHDWHADRDTMPSEASYLYLMTSLLQEEAVVKAYRGDARGAMEDVRLMLRVRKLVADDPRAQTLFYVYRMDYMALGTLKGVLAFCRPDRKSIYPVFAELNGRDASGDMARSLLWETALGIRSYDLSRRDPGRLARGNDMERYLGPYSVLGTFLARHVWLGTADEADFLAAMRCLRENAKNPSSGAPAVFPPRRLPAPQYPPFSVLWRGYVEFPHMVSSEASKADARLCVARTALAIALYRADTGAYPPTLTVLVPAYAPSLPPDPFTGKPFGYTPKERGYVISSPIDPSVNAGVTSSAPVWDFEEYAPEPNP